MGGRIDLKARQLRLDLFAGFGGRKRREWLFVVRVLDDLVRLDVPEHSISGHEHQPAVLRRNQQFSSHRLLLLVAHKRNLIDADRTAGRHRREQQSGQHRGQRDIEASVAHRRALRGGTAGRGKGS